MLKNKMVLLKGSEGLWLELASYKDATYILISIKKCSSRYFLIKLHIQKQNK